MMSKAIMKFTFTSVVIFFWVTRSAADDNSIFSRYSNKMDLHICQNDVTSLNFSNTVISKIGSYFISSPLITCLNLTNNHIEFVEKNAFSNLPNLTHLILSKNNFEGSDKLFYFGNIEKLKVLYLNDAVNAHYKHRRVTTNIFEDYPNLEILYARNNGIPDIQYSPYYSSSDNQYMYEVNQENVLFPKLKVLDLSENNMYSTNFVNFLSNSLQILDLHENELNFIDLSKKGENLIALNLDNNKFQNVEYTKMYYSYSLTLANLKNLRYLSVSGNMIRIIYSTAFRDTINLSYLNLSRNDISELHAETFAKLNYLSVLDLSFNTFKNIPQVSNSINISILILNGNKIRTIIPNTFAQTTKLTKLSLENNEIYEIDAEAFAYLSVLETLDLSNNKLNSLPEGWSKSLVSLKYLDLSNNMFTMLEFLSLTDALPLMKLYFTKNPLEYLNIDYFENLPQNMTVNLIESLNFTQELSNYKYEYDF